MQFMTVVGTPEQKIEWGDQARRLNGIDDLVIIGSVARLAIRVDCGDTTVPSLSLEYTSPLPPHDVRLRDFDGTFPFGPSDNMPAAKATGRHRVDFEFHTLLLNHPSGYRIGYPGRNLPVDEEVFETRIRHVEGVPIRTFTIGTQFCIDGLHASRLRDPKYNLAWDKFGEFARRMRESHPDEFLPEHFYVAFLEFNDQGKLPPR